MKLKEYIAILQTFSQDVEVLKRTKMKCTTTVLTSINKRDIIPPHSHFKYDPKTGCETLVDSYII